jgi:hypothetical protein
MARDGCVATGAAVAEIEKLAREPAKGLSAPTPANGSRRRAIFIPTRGYWDGWRADEGILFPGEKLEPIYLREVSYTKAPPVRVTT